MSNVFSATATVVRNAEVRYLASGASVLNVTVANNIGYGDKQKTLFIRCALFGKRAEGQLKDYLLKGQSVFISGELSENEYQANDGSTKKSLELIANIIDLVGKKSEGGQQQSGGQQAQQNQQPRPTPYNQPTRNESGLVDGSIPVRDNFDDFDDSIPF